MLVAMCGSPNQPTSSAVHCQITPEDNHFTYASTSVLANSTRPDLTHENTAEPTGQQSDVLIIPDTAGEVYTETGTASNYESISSGTGLIPLVSSLPNWEEVCNVHTEAGPPTGEFGGEVAERGDVNIISGGGVERNRHSLVEAHEVPRGQPASTSIGATPQPVTFEPHSGSVLSLKVS